MLIWITGYIAYIAFLQKSVNAFWPYTSYLVDICAVVGFIILFKKRPNFRISYSVEHIMALMLGGVTIFFIFLMPQINIPFDFKSYETIIFLCLVAPILEELVFRFMIIEGLNTKIKNIYLLTTLSALIFSLVHLQAYTVVNPIYKSFVIYQATYTFLLGLWWAFAYLKSRNLYHVMAMHMLFNFGFWLTAYYGF